MRTWSDAPTKTYVIDAAVTELDKGNGVTDVYRNGKLAYTKFSPKEAAANGRIASIVNRQSLSSLSLSSS